MRSARSSEPRRCTRCEQVLPASTTDRCERCGAVVTPAGPTARRQLIHATLLVITLGAIAIAIILADGDDRPTGTTTTPLASPASTQDAPPTTAGQGDDTPSLPDGGADDDWPGGSGFTVVLTTASDRQSALIARNRAARRGHDEAGILDPDRHPSLPGGEWLVYSGAFPSEEEAARELNRILSGFPREYPEARIQRVDG